MKNEFCKFFGKPFRTWLNRNSNFAIQNLRKKVYNISWTELKDSRKDKSILSRQLKFGLIMIIDLNEDRQLNLEEIDYLEEENDTKNG